MHDPIETERAQLARLKESAQALSLAAERGEFRFTSYPSTLGSFDEIASAMAEIEIEPLHPWTAGGARAALAEIRPTWTTSITGIGGGIEACEIQLDGSAWIWISESLADGQGWQCCLYLDDDHEGYYLTGYEAYPRTIAGLRETVDGLIAVRDQVAATYEALFGLEPGTGVALVLVEGGVLVGTIVATDARSVTVETSKGARKTRGLVEIRAAQVIG